MSGPVNFPRLQLAGHGLARTLRDEASRAAGALLGLFLPGACRVCEQPLADASRLPVCSTCLESFQKISPPICTVCGRPLGPWVTAGQDPPRCHLCRKDTYAFSLARSYAIYDQAMSRAVILLKYEAVTPLGEWFGARLEELVRSSPEMLAADVVVPVPLHPARRRERGYNQAELIARPLSRRLKLPLRDALLVRTRPRPDKLKLSRKERWTTVRGAYAPSPGARIDNLRIMLVDDVFTSGATLDACSRALRKAGAKHVFAVTIARTAEAWTEFNLGGDTGLVKSR